MENMGKKKTLGRQKIEIKKIENKNSLQVAFSKRRRGLIHKASELSNLCGVDVAFICQSPGGKTYAFGNIPPESIMDWYLHRDSVNFSRINMKYSEALQVQSEKKNKYLEAKQRLEDEREIEKAIEETRSVNNKSKGFWWDESLYNLDLHELEQYLTALIALNKNVVTQAAASTLLIPNMAFCLFGWSPNSIL